MGFATSARADYIPATWTDTASVGSGVYIGNDDSYTYTHDLTDNGFRPLNDMHLQLPPVHRPGGRRQLLLARWPGIGLRRSAGHGSAMRWSSNFGGSGEEYGGWSILGLLQLNVLGTLTVTISSVYGDFNLVGSNLIGHRPRQRPERQRAGAGRAGPAGRRPDGHGR